MIFKVIRKTGVGDEWEEWAHCLDLDLNGKGPGVPSDGNFSSYLIGRS